MSRKNIRLICSFLMTGLFLLLAACSASNNTGAPTAPSTGLPITGPTSTANAIGVLMVASNPVLGNILTDGKGMTLYVYSQDSPGISNCDDQCAAAWPPYTVQPSNSLAADPAVHGKLGNTQRKDGTYQLTIQNMPLYYFSGDQKPGDVNGQGKGGAWFVLNSSAEPVKTAMPTQSP